MRRLELRGLGYFARFAASLLSVAILTCCAGRSQTHTIRISSPGIETTASEQLVPGDYNNGGRGVLRRIIVSNSSTIPYDIWRLHPTGGIEHLRFVLISPTQNPIESNIYRVMSSGKDCGSASLHFYRDADETHWAILILRIGKDWQAMGSAGLPLTERRFSEDAAYVASIRRSAASVKFYDALTRAERAQLTKSVPRCR